MSKTRIFVDTNVILEAVRTGCWTTICSHYLIETVEKCVEEVLTGDQTDPRRIQVDHTTLNSGLVSQHRVDALQLAELVLSQPHCQGLDDGELHLFAWLQAQQVLPHPLILISTADKAALVAACKLGWIDSLTSLESLAQNCGAAKRQIDSLARHYRSSWLEEIKIKVRLGVIP